MANSNDLISVVTVVYNAKAYIEDTINSVLNQTYPDIEYIIIDGGSTDGTVDIIKKYESQLSFWISEPDNGVYDAMNKGIERAGGKWINFMNAGDMFYSPHSIENVFTSAANYDGYAIVYGDAEFRLRNIAYISLAKESSISQFMPFSHQASFVRSDLAKARKFDLKYRIVADTALSLLLLEQGFLFKHIPTIVCSYDALQGLSAQNEGERAEELVAMQHDIHGTDPDTPYFREFVKDAYKKQRLRKLFPVWLWTRIREHSVKNNNEYRVLNDK